VFVIIVDTKHFNVSKAISNDEIKVSYYYALFVAVKERTYGLDCLD